MSVESVKNMRKVWRKSKKLKQEAKGKINECIIEMENG